MVHQMGLALDVTDTKDAPLYAQIRDAIAGRIKDGTYAPGYRLPATRDLARELGTHRNTVVRAFEELIASGLVSGAVGRGTYVLPQPRGEAHGPGPAERRLPWGSMLARAASSGPLGRFDRLARSTVPGADPVNLQTMQPAPELMPVEPFRRAMAHVLRTVKGKALAYGPREGLPRLRTAIAEHLGEHGVPVRADDLLITSGSQQALDLVARALVDPGDAFLVEAPTYAGAINVLSAAGAELVGVRRDAEGPDLAALAEVEGRRAKGFYLMPECQNPTGSRMSLARRKALIAWSREHRVALIEDDYAADLELDGGSGPPAMRALDADVLYLGTFSKKLIPALRIGFLACPEPLRRPMIALKHAVDLGSSLLLQYALAEFMERGHLRGHLREVTRAYRARRDALEEGLHKHLPKEIEWRHAERGLMIWLAFPPHLHPDTVFEEAQKQGVLVSPGTLSSVDGVASGVRLTFCAETPKRLAEGAKRLGKVFDRLGLSKKSTRTEQTAMSVV